MDRRVMEAITVFIKWAITHKIPLDAILDLIAQLKDVILRPEERTP